MNQRLVKCNSATLRITNKMIMIKDNKGIQLISPVFQDLKKKWPMGRKTVSFTDFILKSYFTFFPNIVEV